MTFGQKLNPPDSSVRRQKATPESGRYSAWLSTFLNFARANEMRQKSPICHVTNWSHVNISSFRFFFSRLSFVSESRPAVSTAGLDFFGRVPRME